VLDIEEIVPKKNGIEGKKGFGYHHHCAGSGPSLTPTQTHTSIFVYFQLTPVSLWLHKVEKSSCLLKIHAQEGLPLSQTII
jgi:hypothetical protein